MAGRRAALARQAQGRPVRELSEAQFQAWVVEKAREAGWTLQFHVLRGQVKGVWLTNTSSPGVPDLWLCRPDTNELVVLELKAERGTVRPGQAEWIAALQRIPGVEAFIVRPSDAAEILALLARPRPANLTPLGSGPSDEQPGAAP